MNFCTKCGAKHETSSGFCTECGSEMKVSGTPDAPGPKQSLPSFSKKTMVIGGSVIAAASLFFGLYKAGEAYIDPEKRLDQFTEAVSEGDAEALMSYLNYAGDGEDFTEESAAAILAYFNDYPYLKDEMLHAFHEQARSYKGNISLAAEEPVHDEYWEIPLITFEKTGKKFFLYDNYEFTVHPQELHVYTNYHDVQFFVNGTETEPQYTHEDMVTLGTFPPGVHNVKAVLDSEFMELEVETDVELFHENYADLWFSISYTEIDSSIAGADIFLNGENTGASVPAEGEYFGPLLLDGSLTMHLEKETPFGTIESQPRTVDSEYMSFSFTLSEEDAESVFETVNEYLHDWKEAKISRSMSSVQHAGPSLREQLTRTINSMNRNDQLYIGSLLTTSFDLDSIVVYEQDGRWQASVSTAENWKEADYYSGYSPNIYDELYNMTYALTYDEDDSTWLISNVESSWGSIGDNVKEYTFEGDDLDAEVHETMMAAVEEDLSQFSSLMQSFVSASVGAINSP
ncbi:hypothetical protein P4475_16545 [Halalkalibacterium halodurans]|uniref:zinc ribbon domain-containing protein n=1 Tax=Halalkalibacterium halodurans TaxID=86665 RepID=UPI001068816A|nr:hypothetical protein [Halalkalibacterium halodurans]MED3648392.1 hypothetical protein [Halalkalibacterium halodurans]TES48944.1 hypothetical protein E2L07_17825 [Halalkalibacterium halodurans]